MKPIYIPHGVSVPSNTLCVDGSISGARTCYSHWVGVDSPKEIAHDLSTGILLNAAKDPEKYFSSFEYVANNHVDADGILSMAVALDPSLLEYEQIMLDAAAYGDFNYFKSEAGARLALRLNQAMRGCAGQYGDGWEHQACKILPCRIREFITESREPDKERDAQIDMIKARIQAIDDGDVRLNEGKSFTQVVCKHEHGHQENDSLDVHQADDLPLWSLNERIKPDQFQLLCLESDEGVYAQFNAPTHSWAMTIDLPMLSLPDGLAAQEVLQQAEGNDVKWVGSPQAGHLDYTCIFGVVDKAGKAAPSSLSANQIAEIVGEQVNLA